MGAAEWILIEIILIAIIGGGYFFIKDKKEELKNKHASE